jgi:putative glutamine amidotransferase
MEEEGARMGVGRRPRIGVSWVERERRDADLLVQAVAVAGGAAVAVPLYRDLVSWDADVATLDGLILSGGNAVDPRRYRQVNLGLCRTVIPERDALEFAALQHCLARRLPVLGICRGVQFLNVALGGSMLQDLTITTVEHEAKDEVSKFHPVTLVPGTRLAGIAGGRREVRVNSRHHQGLRAEHLAPGLRVSALAADGVVEGLEAVFDAFILGIQFHPERPGEVPDLVGVFSALVAAAIEERGRPAKAQRAPSTQSQ